MRDLRFTIYGQIPQLSDIHYFNQTKGILTIQHMVLYPYPWLMYTDVRCLENLTERPVIKVELHALKNQIFGLA